MMGRNSVVCTPLCWTFLFGSAWDVFSPPQETGQVRDRYIGMAHLRNWRHSTPGHLMVPISMALNRNAARALRCARRLYSIETRECQIPLDNAPPSDYRYWFKFFSPSYIII